MAKKAKARKTRARSKGRKPARRKAVRKTTARRPAGRRAKAVRKGRKTRAIARKSAARARTRKKAAPKRTRTPAARAATRTARKKAAPRARAPRAAAKPRVPVGLLRERRTLAEKPSPARATQRTDESRYAGAALTGRDELVEKLLEHTETGPTMTGGDLDADWQGAYSSGNEAPGGENPTPDQAGVDENGKALGIHYEDNEELKLGEKEAGRDRHRWERNPASAENYRRDRLKDKK